MAGASVNPQARAALDAVPQQSCAGRAPSWQDAAWGRLQQGQQTAKAQPVFARLEGDLVISKPEAASAAK